TGYSKPVKRVKIANNMIADFASDWEAESSAGRATESGMAEISDAAVVEEFASGSQADMIISYSINF
nr:hypothetical protein [bacterium]